MTHESQHHEEKQQCGCVSLEDSDQPWQQHSLISHMGESSKFSIP